MNYNDVLFYGIPTIVGYLRPNPFLYIYIYFSVSMQFKCQSIQFSVRRLFSSIWPIDRALSGATTPGQHGLGSDGNEGVLSIPEIYIITGAWPSDCFVS